MPCPPLGQGCLSLCLFSDPSVREDSDQDQEGSGGGGHRHPPPPPLAEEILVPPTPPDDVRDPPPAPMQIGSECLRCTMADGRALLAGAVKGSVSHLHICEARPGLFTAQI